MSVVVLVLVLVVAIPAALALIVWMGGSMLRNSDGTSSGGNALGGFNVFDPARERAEHDLEDKKHQTSVAPAAGGKDQRSRVDTDNNTARIRRPGPPEPPV